MAPARALLSGNRVMVMGGFGGDGFSGGNTAEIHYADSDEWVEAAPIPREHAGVGYAATLPSGKVLHAGGDVVGPDGVDLSEANLALLYDPNGRTTLPDGRVLRAGGSQQDLCPALVWAT